MTSSEQEGAADDHHITVARLFEGLVAVAFDFDGVLVDSVGVKTEAFLALYPQESTDFRAEVVRHHLGHGGVSRLKKIRHYERLRDGREPHSDRVEQLAQRFARAVKDRVIGAPEMPGASRLLARLDGRFPLFVCSGTPEDELQEIVRARGWAGHFDAVMGSPTAKSTMLVSIATRLGCRTDEILLIGDAATDRDAALETGARFLLTAQFTATDRIAQYRGPTVDNLREVIGLL